MVNSPRQPVGASVVSWSQRPAVGASEADQVEVPFGDGRASLSKSRLKLVNSAPHRWLPSAQWAVTADGDYAGPGPSGLSPVLRLPLLHHPWILIRSSGRMLARELPSSLATVASWKCRTTHVPGES